MAVGGAVAIVVGADSFLTLVAVGALSDRAKVIVLGSGDGRNAEREGIWGIAVDAIGAATGIAGNGAAGNRPGVCRREIEDGSEAEDESSVLHHDEDVSYDCL